jgi:predicted DNA binding CopG/RHH family protein
METKALNLRDLPEEFIRRVKSHAALSGMTLKDFVIEAVEKAMHDNGQTKTERKRQKEK